MFYEIYINLKKEILIFRMKLITRIFSAIFFFSLVLVIIFNLSLNEFYNYYIYQKILFSFILFISFISTFYLDEYKFSKKDSSIIIKKGLVFLYKKYSYSFDDLEGIVIKKILKRPNLIFFDFSEKYVYAFGFKIKGSYIIIENRMDEAKYKDFLSSFKAFFPKNIEEINI